MRPNEHWRVGELISYAIFVHLLILKGAFDIYFSSPIDHGMTPVKSTLNPPAKRLVFIVADGLRAETIFGSSETTITPNLDEIRQNRASWGISHTRVPTESRPGHVALFAGIYEDPSAVLQGWKANPVDFDSVINQSTNAWCWGGPSVINMFNKDHLPHIHLYSYDPILEDFGNNNTIGLDLWVFEQVEAFLKVNSQCQNCSLRQEGNFFFLHLLGTDTAGHAFKPMSEGYKNNIRFVDKNIPKVEKLFETTFRDNSTAYVFTSDHGMTNWGSHGAGSDHETQTPLIAWGAGIKIDESRKDVKQIDIAPLMSALIGINYPINSFGQLPSDYIDTSPENLAQMLMSNVEQLLEIFNIKRLRRMTNAIKFVPYQGITSENLDNGMSYLKNLSRLGAYNQLKFELQDFMKFLIDGADYYHNYYQLPLLMSMTIGLFAFIVYLGTFNIHLRRPINVSYWNMHLDKIIIFAFAPIYLNIFVLLYIQDLPLLYYIYFSFPLMVIQKVCGRYLYLCEALRNVNKFGVQNAAIQTFVYLLGLRLLVQAFHTREALSLVMYILAVFVFWSESLKIHSSRVHKICWICLCIMLACFLFLPVMKTTFNLTSYLTGYSLWWVFFEKLILNRMEKDISNKFVLIQASFFKLTPLYTLAVEFGYVPFDSYIKYVALIWAVTPIILIPLTSTRIFTRLTSIFLGFGTYYLMVSPNYESFFMICYVSLLYTWLKIESRCFGYATIIKKDFSAEINEIREQTSDDYRRAFFFVTFIFLGFFGTGNVASLSSFDPMWVRCFITVFSPFKIAALIIFKVAVPFIFASCVFRAVNLFRKGNTLSIFCIVLMFSDIMLLELMYSITNIGSWLEIGMSLSQFVIMELFVIILLFLYGIGYFLTTKSY